MTYKYPYPSVSTSVKYCFGKALLHKSSEKSQVKYCLISSGCHNKVPQTGWLDQLKFISQHFWKLEVQAKGDNMVVFWWDLFRLLSSFHLPVGSHDLILNTEKEGARSLISPLVRTLILLGQSPSLRTLFNLITTLEAPSPKIDTLGS